MGLDYDYVVAKDQLKEIEKILSDAPHGKRGRLASEMVYFVNKLKELPLEYDIILPDGIVENVKQALIDDGCLEDFINYEDDLIAWHHGLGTWIRNEYKLWNSDIAEKYISEDVFIHPDDLSFEMMKEIQKQLKGE